ncbi:Hypothetical protein PHPALM_37009 [Phytophthora palmivora]|uniref:Uncharacterized protein n=1 Tax=Phytophthora palmivora TaxID=4796 RepID=A0A2P4WYH2_9STRA|nr:Hypothetical protein PHPALM_37009 [Phytophthora palmivora]
MVRKRRVNRTREWWRYGDDEGATLQDTTFSTTISDPYKTDKPRTTMESNGGCQRAAQMSCMSEKDGDGDDKNCCTFGVVLKMDKGSGTMVWLQYDGSATVVEHGRTTAAMLDQWEQWKETRL